MESKEVFRERANGVRGKRTNALFSKPYTSIRKITKNYFLGGIAMVKSVKTIDFREFMKGNTEPVKKKKCTTSYSMNAYSLVITPGMFLDPTFILIGGGVVVLAVTEKMFGISGHTEIAEMIGKIFKFVFPFVVAVIGYIFFSTNPLLHWM
jgi:hypothetical protein